MYNNTTVWTTRENGLKAGSSSQNESLAVDQLICRKKKFLWSYCLDENLLFQPWQVTTTDETSINYILFNWWGSQSYHQNSVWGSGNCVHGVQWDHIPKLRNAFFFLQRVKFSFFPLFRATTNYCATGVRLAVCHAVVQTVALVSRKDSPARVNPRKILPSVQRRPCRARNATQSFHLTGDCMTYEPIRKLNSRE